MKQPTNKSLKYNDNVKINNTIKLREHASQLPEFCKEYFRGIETRTSSRTRLSYAYDLELFFYFLLYNCPQFNSKTSIIDFKLTDLDLVSATNIEEYLEYLSYYSKNNKIYTNDEAGLKRKLTSLRSFYTYFYKKQSIKTNPASFVDTPKIHTKEIVRLDVNEVADLLDKVEFGENLTDNQKKYHSKTKTRDLAIMTLLLGTGIRVSECVGIDINDIDFDNSGIKITRKGGNESTVYFGDEVYDALIEYYNERKTINAATGHENAFFLSMQKKRINVRSVENLVKKYSQLVTTIKNITPHKLRSTYGTSLYKETGDIYLVADVLGHKDVNTTRRHYAAVDDSRRRSAKDMVTLREEK